MIRWYAVSERIVFPFETPVETKTYQLTSAPQWPIMKTTASRSPPASDEIKRALPTESHQIQKYGFAALVTSPAMYGFSTACAGAVLRLAVLLPTIVRIPKMMSAMPPITAIAVVYGCATACKAENDQEKYRGLDNDMAERDPEPGRPVTFQGSIDGGDQRGAGGERSREADKEAKDQRGEDFGEQLCDSVLYLQNMSRSGNEPCRAPQVRFREGIGM